MQDIGARIADADWQTIDGAIVALANKNGEIDVEIGRWLIAAQRERVDRRFGYGSFYEYVERRLGYDPRVTREKLRVAHQLEELPKLRALLSTGERAWSAVREIVRIATPTTEAVWIEKTEGMTSRQIEKCVTGRKPGDLPTDEKDPLLYPRRMVFELMPEDFAIVEEACERVREELGPSASRVEVLRAMAERVLGGREEKSAGYATSLTVCVSCERAWQDAGGDVVEVSSANAACARCDGEVVGFTRIDEGVVEVETTHVGHGTSNIESEQPDEVKRAIGARHLLRLAAKAFNIPRKSMTPRLRAAVRARDRGRCVVPGCRNFRFVDLHHHKPRSAGGPNVLDNLYCLCTQHHRAVHEGLLAIEGSPSEGLVVRQANGARYGLAS